MGGKSIEDADFYDTGYSYALSLINGKYKPIILYCLMEYEPVRFNEMQRYLKKVADKTLSQNLKELEADGLIVRGAYPQIPSKVEYSLKVIGGVPLLRYLISCAIGEIKTKDDPAYITGHNWIVF